MNKTATIAAIILFALLFLSCEEKQELTEDNPKALEAKLKKEYEKRFEVPISDFELSVTSVNYYYHEDHNDFLDISITRTVTGAIVKYMNYETYGPEYELKLDVGEWLDFVNALHKKCSRVILEKDIIKSDDMLHLNPERRLKISFSSPKEFSQYYLYKTEIVKLMDSMIEGIKKRTATDIAASIKVLETKLKEEYEKKFSISMSDFELSVTRVKYYYYDDYANYISLAMSITRTATGAIAKYMAYKDYGPEYELKLDIGEWLDFVNALYKCKVSEKKDTIKSDVMLYLNRERRLKILFSSPEEFSEYHLDRAEIVKMMDSTMAGIKKRTATKIAASIEPKLKEEYEKNSGFP